MGDFNKPFFRRRRYHGKTATPPKWHRLVKTEIVVGVNGFRWRTVEALCGYTYEWEVDFNADMLEHKTDVKTARLRCSKCDREHVKQIPRGDRYSNQDGEGL